MREVTIQEFVNDLQGATVEIESVDTYGVSISFSKARIEYDEDMNELAFVSGKYDTQWGIGSVCYKIDDCIDCISVDDNGVYTIEFSRYMSDITITRTQTIRKAVQ